MATKELKDSGQRREFNTGSVRDTAEGKGRFDLLSPIAMVRDAQHMEAGAKKYADRNWEKGQPLSVFINSAMRHLQKLQLGLTDEDHASAAVWNINAYRHVLMMIEVGELPAELDDRPTWKPGTAEKVAAMLFPDCETSVGIEVEVVHPADETVGVALLGPDGLFLPTAGRRAKLVTPDGLVHHLIGTPRWWSLLAPPLIRDALPRGTVGIFTTE